MRSPNNENAVEERKENIWNVVITQRGNRKIIPNLVGWLHVQRGTEPTDNGNIIDEILPQNKGCRQTGRLYARSCIVLRQPGHNPSENRSPTDCRTPKLTCSDDCSTASRTVVVAAAAGPWCENSVVLQLFDPIRKLT